MSLKRLACCQCGRVAYAQDAAGARESGWVWRKEGVLAGMEWTCVHCAAKAQATATQGEPTPDERSDAEAERYTLESVERFVELVQRMRRAQVMDQADYACAMVAVEKLRDLAARGFRDDATRRDIPRIICSEDDIPF